MHEDGTLICTGYDVGTRIDNEIKNEGNGQEVRVVWWQEFVAGSDVWYQTWRQVRKWEYEDILETIEQIFVEAEDRIFNQLLIWNTTTVNHV